MGSNKFLIVVFAIVTALTLSLVGVSAVDMVEADTLEVVSPSEERLLETDELIRSSADTYPALPLLEKNYYRYDVKFLAVPYPVANALNVCSISVFDSNGQYLAGASNGDGASLYRSGTGVRNWGFYFGDVFYQLGTDGVNGTVYGNMDCVIISTESELSLFGGTVQGTLVQSNLVDDVAGGIWSVGESLMTFVVSSWVVLLPLSCWLVVLCIGAIRKLVKGV